MQAVIFDLDGVLVDSPAYAWESFARVLGVTFTREHIRQSLASSLRENVKVWEKEFGVKVPDIETFAQEAGKIQFELMEGMKVDAYLMHFLQSLREHDVKMAVGTSSMKWRAEKMLDMFELRSYFEVVVTADDVHRHKPHPDVFLTAAKRLRATPQACVVIEDAVHGIQAAHNGNMKAVGVVSDYYSAQDLRVADMVVRSFSELSVSALKELVV